MSGSPPRAIPTRFFAAASSGITISDATRIPIASGEESGVSPSTRLRTPSNVTYPARRKNVTATSRSARRSRRSSKAPSRNRADSLSATSTPAIDSIAESTPKPTTETSPAIRPAVIAIAPSATLYATVNWASLRPRRVSCSRVSITRR